MPSEMYAHPVDPLISQIACGYSNMPFVADRILPPVTVTEKSATYPIWGKEVFRVKNLKADERSDITELTFEYATSTFDVAADSEAYFIPNHRSETAPFNERVDAAELLKEQLDLAREKEVLDTVTSASYIANSDSPTTKWDGITPAIVAYIESRKLVIAQKIGKFPNVLVLGRDAFNVVANDSDILSRIQYTQRGVVTAELLAELFGLDEVLVPLAIYDSANEGQTFSGDLVWPDETGLLLYRPPTTRNRETNRNETRLKTPSLGKQLFWNAGASGAGTGGTEVRFWDHQGAPKGTGGGTWAQVSLWHKPVITCSDAAERLTNLLT